MIPALTKYRSGGAPTGIAAYFASGERGIWLDPSDFSTMFQDAAGTTPVTAVGQSVGLIRDKSGNGIDFSQSTSTKRPVLGHDADGYYLQFTAANSQFLKSASRVSLEMQTDSACIFSKAAFDTNTSSPVILAKAYASSNIGRYWLFATSGNTLETDFQSTGSDVYAASNAFSSTATHLFSSTIDRTSALIYLRLDQAAFGSQVTLATGSPTANISTTSYTRLGAYGDASDSGETGNYMDGRIYNLVLRFTPTINTTDRNAIEALLA